MRIVIETDPSDESRSTTQAAESQRGELVLDGGPAPTALLRRFGRLPEARAEGEGPEQGERSGEAGQAVLNPLRHGAAVAAQGGGSGGRVRVRDETAEEGDDVPPEDLDAR